MRAVILGFAAVMTAATSALAADWDMATPYSDATFHTQNIREFVKEVEEVTNGEIRITVHSAGSLFAPAEIKNAVRSRQIPIGEIFLSSLVNENSAFGVDSLPSLATSYEDALKLWEAQRPVITRLLAEQNLLPLYSVAWPTPGLYTKFEVKEMSDLSGLRFRAYNAVVEQFARIAGMSPVQIQEVDVPQAFSTGAVEAMITSATTGANAKAWDFLSHFTPIEPWVPKNLVIMNKRVFDQLSAETQEAILEAAKRAELRGWEMSKAENETKIKELVDGGITVYEPSENLAKGFFEVGAKVLEDWIAAASPEGQEIIDAYRQ